MMHNWPFQDRLAVMVLTPRAHHTDGDGGGSRTPSKEWQVGSWGLGAPGTGEEGWALGHRVSAPKSSGALCVHGAVSSEMW